MKIICEKHCIAFLGGIFIFGIVMISGCVYPNQMSDTLFKNKPDPFSQAPTLFSPTGPSISQENGTSANRIPLEHPEIKYGINEKLSYDEEKRLIQNFTPSSTIPESEMARIIFSKSWFLQNDEDPQPDIVRLTFPAAWQNSSQVNENESVVLLRVPKRMLEIDDSNPDPLAITVSYPYRYFREYSNLQAINVIFSP